MRNLIILKICIGLLLLGLTSCRRKAPTPIYHAKASTTLRSAQVQSWEAMPLRQLPNFGQDLGAWATWQPHLERTWRLLSYSKSLPPSQVEPDWDRQQMLDCLSKLLKASQGNEKDFWARLETDFVVLKASSKEQLPAFFTGYYSPIFKGSRKASARFNTPIYKVPGDLKEQASSYTRKAIDRQQKLEGKNLELCYLESPLDAFLLHVQGSATVVTPEGERIGLGYGGSNGMAYSSLGKMMIERGLSSPESMSLGTIMEAYANNPKAIESLMLENERYIFFRESDGRPRGSTGAVVEGLHTLATERSAQGVYRFLPHQPALVSLSMPGIGETTLPVLCQDTGSAIVGAVRADLYIGEGPIAQRIAGKLKHRGELLLLWPKSIALPYRIGGIPVEDAGTMPKA
jgi:membrane-bound lytic murein transglycosylase A